MSTDITQHGTLTESNQAETVTGPHAGYDAYGRLDHYFWRCEVCGLEATASKLAHGCWRCEEDNA